MQVSKWGNSLAVRLPAAVVQELKLKEGDNIELAVQGEGKFGVRIDTTREQALESLRKLRRPLPPNYKFDREDANAR